MSGKLMPALRGDLELHADDIRRLQNPAVGGVILFARNFSDGAQLRQLTAAIRRAAAPRPVLIAVDQEGGRKSRFFGDGFTAVPAPAALAKSKNPAQAAAAAGLVLAAEVLAHGVDLTFAPLLDVDYGNSEIIGDRAFSPAPDVVADLALHFAAGLRRGGASACGKHFPGHGYAAADSHETLPTDSRAKTELQQSDLIPFAKCAASFPLLMTAHIVYPKVCENPATFSAVWLKDILRGELNFGGLVVGDDLSMAGAAVVGDVAARLAAADAAGCDLHLVCNPEEVDAAVDFAAKKFGNDENKNLWRQLARAHLPRAGVGDAEYGNARALLEEIN